MKQQQRLISITALLMLGVTIALIYSHGTEQQRAPTISVATTITTTTEWHDSEGSRTLQEHLGTNETLSWSPLPPSRDTVDEEDDDEDDDETLFPTSLKEILGFLLATSGLILAAGGGIGGGGLLVPIYILILQLKTRHAIPLSNVTVFGGAVANTLLNARKRHPLTDRPLMDWDLIYIMEPITMAGALGGVHLNKLLPELAIVILLMVVLALTATKTLKKAKDLYNKERFKALPQHDDDEELEGGNENLELTTILPASKTIQSGTQQRRTNARLLRRTNSEPTLHARILEASHSNPMQLKRTQSLPNDSIPGSHWFHEQKIDQYHTQKANVIQARQAFKTKTTKAGYCQVSISDGSSEQAILEEILESERKPPVRNVLIIVGMFLIVLCINILKGGGGFASPLGISCGSIAFWFSEFLIILLVVGVTLDARRYLLRKQSLKLQTNYKFIEGDIQWDEQSSVIYPMLCCIAGFVAGLFGIGGGIVKGPIMLALGIHPSVASATSACMILFTSFTATTSFLVFGLVLKDYALFCLVMGFSATILGQTFMSYLLKKYQRHSYVAFCIGIVVALSAVAMTVESIIGLVNASHNPVHRSSGLCSSHME